MYPILFYPYILILALCVLVGIFRFKIFKKNVHFVFTLTVLGLATEVIVYLIKLIFNQKAPENHKYLFPLYHAYILSVFIVVIIYFAKTVKLRVNNTRYLILSVIILECINNLYFQHLNQFNSNMCILESFFATIFALYCLYTILISEQIGNVLKYPHFWFWALILMSSCCTFFFWALVAVFQQNKIYMNVALNVSILINALYYSGLAIVFYHYPKMQTNEY
jgi:hypothetical protein